MPSAQVLPPFESFMDVDGNPLEDGYIYIGADALDPEANPISAFFDEALTVPAFQPIRTKGGYPSKAGAPSRIYVGPTSYSIRVKNKNGTTVHSDLSITSPTDSSSISFVQAGAGAVVRPLQEKVREQPISVEDYIDDIVYVEAPYGQAEVDAATEADDAIDAAILAAVTQGRKIQLPAKVYKCTRTSEWRSLLNIEGVACGAWNPTMNPSIAGGVYAPDMGGTIFLFCGNGAKTHTALGVTDCRTGGGVVANDNIHEPGFDDSYSLSSFYNNDANFTTGAAATPKLFSVGVNLGRGVHGVVAKNIRIMKAFRGINGYEIAEIGYGDDWDVGLKIENADDNYFENVQVVGYWQMCGRLARVGVVGGEGSSLTASIEHNVFDRCVFTGMVGSEIRGIDSHRIIGVGADYIDLPWAANHPFDVTALAGSFRTSSSTFHAFTGVSVVAGNLRLTGVTPTPSGLPLTASVIPASMSNGMALWEDRNCIISSMDHQSGNRVTAVAMGAFRKNRPSTGSIISGFTLRGYSAPGTKIILQDDVAFHCHWVTDTILGPKYEMESKDANGLGLGARVISSPSESLNTRVANPSGQSFRLEVDTLRNSSDIDYRPVGTLTPPRFPLGNGYLLANTIDIKAVNYAIDNGPFSRPGVGGQAGLKRSNGGLAAYYDDSTGQLRSAVDLRLDSNLLLNSAGTQKINVTGGSASVNAAPFLVNSSDGLTVNMRIASTEWRAGTTNTTDIGTATIKFKDTYSVRYFIGTASVVQAEGSGTPEGVVTAPIGSTYQRREGGALTSFYVKESGAGNTGWVAK